MLRQTVDETVGGARERLTQLMTACLEQPLEDQQVVQLVPCNPNQFADRAKRRLIMAFQEALPNQIEAIIADDIVDDQISSGDARLMA